MKRRRFCIIFLLLSFALLGGCKNKQENPKESTQAVSGEKEAEGEKADRIIMTYLTYGSRLDDLDEVLDAVNAISVPEIGVEVELKIVDTFDSYSQYYLWLSGGERVDLMMIMYQDVTSYIAKHLLRPIDGLLEKDAPRITALIEEERYPLTEGACIKNQSYGVTVVPDQYGASGGIYIPEEYLEAVGFDYDGDKIYTLDELTELFRRLKEKYPNQYPLGQITRGNQSTTFSYYNGIFDVLGADSTSGVLMGTDSTEVVNLFAEQEYYDFLEHLREWYLKGYIYPDAAIADADISELIREEIIMSYPLGSTPGMNQAMEIVFGKKTVCLRLSEEYTSSQTAKASFWTVPATSRAPDAAMKFLNLMYEDSRISNLFLWGIEGKHYVVKDEENRLIGWPDGIGADEVGYRNTLGLYGDSRNFYRMSDDGLAREREEYSENARNNPTRGKGFSYSWDKMAREISDIQKVVEKYAPVLESGSIDLDVYYPKFLQELEWAGIDRAAEDKQMKFDVWLKENRE